MVELENGLHPVVDIKFTLDEYLETTGILDSSYEHEHNEMIAGLSEFLELPYPVIDLVLKSGSFWKSTLRNKKLTTKLLKRHIIKKIHKGHYKINPYFTQMFKDMMQPKTTTEYKLACL
jgi:hypothetical protein